MAIIEICNSTFNHTPIDSLEKVYLKHRFKDKIICEKCLSAYIGEVSKTLSNEIFNCIKNTSMKSIIETSDINRDDKFSYTYEKSLINNFMQYILPIKFKLNISFMYEILNENSNYNPESDTTNDIVRISMATIEPIVCDSTYPSFTLVLDIRETDTEAIITNQIEEYLESFILTFFKELPNVAVQNLMNIKKNGQYSSSCANSIKSLACSNCSIDISGERYIYNNVSYCLDCMYAIAVESAVNNNLADDVGLSDISDSSSYAIVNSIEWKRSVINKYIHAMESLGIKLNITHAMMTCY